jgi:hypothetical protein
MLTIIVEGQEFFNEETETFESVNNTVLEFEHSLVSLSKWESEFQKPFLSSDSKTPEEIFYYVKCMSLNQIDDETINSLSESNLITINEYIQSSQSATTFGVMPEQRGRGEVITAELIYYWLVAFQIPFSCECWHLNRLFSLIRICNIKNSKPNKMSKNDIAARNRDLNAQRKAQLGTSG